MYGLNPGGSWPDDDDDASATSYDGLENSHKTEPTMRVKIIPWHTSSNKTCGVSKAETEGSPNHPRDGTLYAGFLANGIDILCWIVHW